MNIQQEFEACLGYPHDFSKDQSGSYSESYVQAMWVGWKLAHNKYHKDIVVDLSTINVSEFTKYKFKQVLDEAGVKY